MTEKENYMLSKHMKKVIIATSVALIMGTSFVIPNPIITDPITVEAAVVNSQTGNLTVTASSIWTYGSANWSDRAKTYPKGTTFSVTQKLNIDGREMYKLTNGSYISANPEYISFTATSAEPSATTASTKSTTMRTTANLNLRTGASTNHGIILTIPKGTDVTVTSINGGWASVNYNGNAGYVSATYLEGINASTPEPTPPEVSINTALTTDNLNMRGGAGTTYPRILTIPKGSEVTVLSESGGWANIKYNNQEGYVSSNFLKTVTPNPEVKPEEIPTEGKDMRMVTGNLYMRTEPDGNSSVITILEKGTIVEVESLTNQWAKITYNGQVGYASTNFMTPVDPDNPTVPETPEVVLDIRVTTQNLNLRTGPSTNDAVMLTIPKGSTLTVTEITGGWGKVTYEGQTGYASLDYMVSVGDFESYGKMDQVGTVNYDNVDITVSGLANMGSGVRDVKVFLNSRIQGTASYGIKRSDDENKNTGYSYIIKRNNLFPGENKVIVEVNGNNGEKLTYTKIINVNKKPVIVIDPGHGGKDSGASGMFNGIKVSEKTYALAFATELNKVLSASGFTTIMTRADDRFIELSDRATIANNNHADLFFSFHHDSSSNASAKGAFVIYPSAKTKSISESIISESADVAEYVKKSMLDMGFTSRRNGTDQSISGYTLAVLRQTQVRSILAEFGFMSNAEDLSKITDPVFQKAMAQNLTKQLKLYFQMK